MGNVRFCRSFDGVRVAFEASGSGPPLVQAPTWMTHLELDDASVVWHPWLDELRRDHTLVRYDLRGCGLSDRKARDHSLSAWVADLEVVVDVLGLDRFPLFGLCQGAVIAAAFAAQHPDRVSRLVLYGGYARGALARGSASADTAEVTALATLIRTGWGQPAPTFREVFARLLMPEAPVEVVRAFTEMERHSATPETARRLWLTFHRLDITAIAPSIAVPTLVIHSRNDRMVPFEEGRRLASLIPGARFVALEGCNHILRDDEPCWERMWQEVHGFLAKGRAAGTPEETSTLADAALFAALTARERELLDLIARARSNDEIAAALAISPKTVRNHITSIFAKLGVTRRAEAIVMARDAGLGLSPPPRRAAGEHASDRT